MRLLCSIIFILFSTVDRLGNQFSVRNTVTTEFVCYDFSRLPTMRLEQPFEKTLCCSTIALGLEKYINHFSILINCSPQIVLLLSYFHKYFINIESISETRVPTLESLRIFRTKLVTP